MGAGNDDFDDDDFLRPEEDSFSIADTVERVFASCFHLVGLLLMPWRWVRLSRPRSIDRDVHPSGIVRANWRVRNLSDTIGERFLGLLGFFEWLFYITFVRWRENVLSEGIVDRLFSFLEFIDWVMQSTIQGLLFVAMPWKWFRKRKPVQNDPWN